MRRSQGAAGRQGLRSCPPERVTGGPVAALQPARGAAQGPPAPRPPHLCPQTLENGSRAAGQQEVMLSQPGEVTPRWDSPGAVLVCQQAGARSSTAGVETVTHLTA